MRRLGRLSGGVAAALVVQAAVPGVSVGEAIPSSPTLASLQPANASRLWEQVARDGAPLIEPDTTSENLKVTFLWRGDSHREIELSWPVWTPDRGENRLTRMDGTDIWYKTVLLPPKTRLSYQLAPDPVRGPPGDREAYRAGLVAALRDDPLNPKRMGKMSLLELPDAPDQPYVAKRSTVPEGSVHTDILHMNGRNYEITLYRPANIAAKDKTPLVVIFDAERYLTDIPTPVILDNMIHEGVIPPVSAVLIRNPTRQSRGEDLACNPVFAKVLAETLVPWVGRRLAITETAEDRVLAGSSFGGLMSVCTALTYPAVFGKALSQSGSFWWNPQGVTSTRVEDHAMIKGVRETRRKPVQIYLDAGVLEQRPGSDNLNSIYVTSAALFEALQTKGYRASFHRVAGGHDDATWRGTLSDGLIELLGTKR